ncbi:hypothetical protein NQ317_019058 [Molorchus minor]|uniref:Uncharacterized protein n=1 Tax=Molorchus minor TaxID=1323400 RepID=A0ABQ9JZ94_9CUCU|nr:hypothetical protein NQ317_019058 [Molorchus minor]
MVSQCEEADVTSVALKRAMSCDSICSDTSVALGDLEMFNVTGYLCIGLEYDRITNDFCFDRKLSRVEDEGNILSTKT